MLVARRHGRDGRHHQHRHRDGRQDRRHAQPPPDDDGGHRAGHGHGRQHRGGQVGDPDRLGPAGHRPGRERARVEQDAGRRHPARRAQHRGGRPAHLGHGAQREQHREVPVAGMGAGGGGVDEARGGGGDGGGGQAGPVEVGRSVLVGSVMPPRGPRRCDGRVRGV